MRSTSRRRHGRWGSHAFGSPCLLLVRGRRQRRERAERVIARCHALQLQRLGGAGGAVGTLAPADRQSSAMLRSRRFRTCGARCRTARAQRWGRVELQCLPGSLVPACRKPRVVLRRDGCLGSVLPRPGNFRGATLRRCAGACGAAAAAPRAPGESAQRGGHPLGHPVGVDGPDSVLQRLAILGLLPTLGAAEGLQDHAEVIQAREAKQRAAAWTAVVEI
mmetsp:Transcript_123243/g.343723  ORF Transcript_123243/g.343723 Transcript_123243/m.343723 type:complete len:220 (+) Transcript_123243:70-729(+)